MANPTDADAYLDTLRRMEPEIHPVDAAAFYASASISLKRIADSLEFFQNLAHHGLILAGKNDPKALEVLERVYGQS